MTGPHIAPIPPNNNSGGKTKTKKHQKQSTRPKDAKQATTTYPTTSKPKANPFAALGRGLSSLFSCCTACPVVIEHGANVPYTGCAKTTAEPPATRRGRPHPLRARAAALASSSSLHALRPAAAVPVPSAPAAASPLSTSVLALPHALTAIGQAFNRTAATALGLGAACVSVSGHGFCVRFVPVPACRAGRRASARFCGAARIGHELFMVSGAASPACGGGVSFRLESVVFVRLLPPALPAPTAGLESMVPSPCTAPAPTKLFLSHSWPAIARAVHAAFFRRLRIGGPLAAASSDCRGPVPVPMPLAAAFDAFAAPLPGGDDHASAPFSAPLLLPSAPPAIEAAVLEVPSSPLPPMLPPSPEAHAPEAAAAGDSSPAAPSPLAVTPLFALQDPLLATAFPSPPAAATATATLELAGDGGAPPPQRGGGGVCRGRPRGRLTAAERQRQRQQRGR